MNLFLFSHKMEEKTLPTSSFGCIVPVISAFLFLASSLNAGQDFGTWLAFGGFWCTAFIIPLLLTLRTTILSKAAFYWPISRGIFFFVTSCLMGLIGLSTRSASVFFICFLPGWWLICRPSQSISIVTNWASHLQALTTSCVCQSTSPLTFYFTHWDSSPFLYSFSFWAAMIWKLRKGARSSKANLSCSSKNSCLKF